MTSPFDRSGLVSPKDQVEDPRSPALALKRRYLEKLRNAFERGGMPAVEALSSRTFDDTASDDLTGLFTRRMFFKLLQKIVLPRMRRAKANGTVAPFGSVVMIDFDKFKLINEQFGHSGGDEVLRRFGPMLEQQFREDDVIGRVGGDEFVIVAVNLAEEDVEERMQNLRDEFESYAWDLPRIDGAIGHIRVCFSFSYDVVPIDDPEQIENLIDTADRNVFAQKRDRRISDNSSM